MQYAKTMEVSEPIEDAEANGLHRKQRLSRTLVNDKLEIGVEAVHNG